MKRHTNFINRIGEKYTTNEGYKIEIIEYFNNVTCTILFEDGTILYNKQYVDIIKGSIKNPFHKSVTNVGYFGEGKYKSTSHSTFWKIWSNMLKKCYNIRVQENQPTYKNVTVCEEWHNFQNFAEWSEKNYVCGFVLDKDIICKECKIYSPETCCFVPQEINSLFVNGSNKKYPTGVFKRGNKFVAQISIKNTIKNLGSFSIMEKAIETFKTAKQQHIRKTANEWKNKLDINVFNHIIKHAE